MQSAPPPGIGTLLAGRYRLGAEIGRGGMGAVYDAVQENLGRRVAVKLLRADLASEPNVLARFEREARVVGSLGHPNIVQVIDFEHAPGQAPFLVMEKLEGRSLKSLLRERGSLEPARVAGLARQVLAALAAAHDAGVVHRDIKPDNVFLVDAAGVGEVAKLLDFGVAKLMESRTYERLTATGVVIGTPAYMAPEQLSGGAVDARTDLHALAVVLYEALTGARPFAGETHEQLIRAILLNPAQPIARFRRDVPAPLANAIERALAKDPVRRFASATEMREAVARDAFAHAAPPTGLETTRDARAASYGSHSVPPQGGYAATTAPGRARRNAVIGLIAALAVVAVTVPAAWIEFTHRDHTPVNAPVHLAPVAPVAPVAVAAPPASKPLGPTAPNALTAVVEPPALRRPAARVVHADRANGAPVTTSGPTTVGRFACRVEVAHSPSFDDPRAADRALQHVCSFVSSALTEAQQTFQGVARSCWTMALGGPGGQNGMPHPERADGLHLAVADRFTVGALDAMRLPPATRTDTLAVCFVLTPR